MGRLGGLSEAAWKRVLAFSSHLEESLALLGGALKPRVDWRTNLRRLGGGLEPTYGVLKVSWRHPGGVLEASQSFLADLFWVLDMVTRSLSIFRRIFSTMKD